MAFKPGQLGYTGLQDHYMQRQSLQYPGMQRADNYARVNPPTPQAPPPAPRPERGGDSIRRMLQGIYGGASQQGQPSAPQPFTRGASPWGSVPAASQSPRTSGGRSAVPTSPSWAASYGAEAPWGQASFFKAPQDSSYQQQTREQPVADSWNMPQNDRMYAGGSQYFDERTGPVADSWADGGAEYYPLKSGAAQLIRPGGDAHQAPRQDNPPGVKNEASSPEALRPYTTPRDDGPYGFDDYWHKEQIAFLDQYSKPRPGDIPSGWYGKTALYRRPDMSYEDLMVKLRAANQKDLDKMETAKWIEQKAELQKKNAASSQQGQSVGADGREALAKPGDAQPIPPQSTGDAYSAPKADAPSPMSRDEALWVENAPPGERSPFVIGTNGPYGLDDYWHKNQIDFLNQYSSPRAGFVPYGWWGQTALYQPSDMSKDEFSRRIKESNQKDLANIFSARGNLQLRPAK